MGKKLSLIWFVLFLSVSSIPEATARVFKGVAMEEKRSLDGKALHLNGVVLYEATVFRVDVYVGGLYVESRTQHAQKIMKQDASKQYVQHYLRNVAKRRVKKAWKGFLSKKSGSAAVRNEVTQFINMIQNIKKNDRVVISYIPNKGLMVKQNAKILGMIKGKRFANFFFGCFVGPNAPTDLRDSLLARK